MFWKSNGLQINDAFPAIIRSFALKFVKYIFLCCLELFSQNYNNSIAQELLLQFCSTISDIDGRDLLRPGLLKFYSGE